MAGLMGVSGPKQEKPKKTALENAAMVLGMLTNAGSAGSDIANLFGKKK